MGLREINQHIYSVEQYQTNSRAFILHVYTDYIAAHLLQMQLVNSQTVLCCL